MSYIKIKKVWEKRFPKSECEEIFKMFQQNSPVPTEEWKELSLTEAVAKHGQFIHPETDKEDDTEGVHPRQILNLKEILKDDYQAYLVGVINILNEHRNQFNSFMSDGFISWDRVWETYIVPNINQAKEKRLGLLKISLSPVFSKFTSIDNEVIEKIGLGEITEFHIQEAINAGTLNSKSKNLKMEYLDLKAFFEERRRIWKELTKIAPQSEYMLRVNPLNFNQQQLAKVEELYGVRQIGKLKEEDQKNISLYIDNFGMNLIAIPAKNLRPNGLQYGSQPVKDYRHVIEKIYRADDLNINAIKNIIYALENYQPFEEFIMKQNLGVKDIAIILYISEIVCQMNGNINDINPDYFRIFYRYGILGINDIKALVTLFERNKDKNTTIPLIKGQVGNYSYEIIDKNNPIGLILGYATDCCQVIGGAGQSCLMKGYEHKDSSFFVVTKNNKVYAQSWIWSKELTAYGTGFCFDSVEVLGKNLNQSKDILKCYQEAAKQLAKHYDVVYCGADGNTMPDGLEKIGKHLDMDDVYRHQLQAPFDCYSDLTRDNGGAYIIEKGN